MVPSPSIRRSGAGGSGTRHVRFSELTAPEPVPRNTDDASVLSSTSRSWRDPAAYGTCRSPVGDIAP